MKEWICEQCGKKTSDPGQEKTWISIEGDRIWVTSYVNNDREKGMMSTSRLYSLDFCGGVCMLAFFKP